MFDLLASFLVLHQTMPGKLLSAPPPLSNWSCHGAARCRQFVPQAPVSRSCFRRGRPYVVAVPSCPALRPASASVRFPHVADSPPCFLLEAAACVHWGRAADGGTTEPGGRRRNGKIGSRGAKEVEVSFPENPMLPSQINLLCLLHLYVDKI